MRQVGVGIGVKEDRETLMGGCCEGQYDSRGGEDGGGLSVDSGDEEYVRGRREKKVMEVNLSLTQDTAPRQTISKPT